MFEILEPKSSGAQFGFPLQYIISAHKSSVCTPRNTYIFHRSVEVLFPSLPFIFFFYYFFFMRVPLTKLEETAGKIVKSCNYGNVELSSGKKNYIRQF